MVMLFCRGKRSAPNEPASFETARALVLPGNYLVGIGDPGVLGANVGDTLVLVPVIGLGEGLVDNVVKVAGEQSPRQLVFHAVRELSM
jgi:hypothetical protein